MLLVIARDGMTLGGGFFPGATDCCRKYMNTLEQDPFEKLQSLIRQPVFASLANDSLLLLFEAREGGRVSERLVLRVNHPWRLLLEGGVVGQSREFFSGRSSQGHQSLVDWDRWSRDFANWIPVRLTGMSIGVDSPDLRLVFQSGHVLESISEAGVDADWSLKHQNGAEILNARKLARFPWGSLCFQEKPAE